MRAKRGPLKTPAFPGLAGAIKRKWEVWPRLRPDHPLYSAFLRFRDKLERRYTKEISK